MKITVAAIMVATALAGCSSMTAESTRMAANPNFDNKNPKVFVREKCDQKAAHIVVDQEPIHFFRSDTSGSFDIVWRLMTPGYTFGKVADPVALPGSAKDGISGCGKSASGRTMTCTNQNSGAGTWKYTLSVAPDSDNKCGAAPRDLDPYISND